MALPNNPLIPDVIGDAVCSTPVVGQACRADDLPAAVAGSVGSNVLDSISQKFAEGFTEVMTSVTTFWVDTDSANLPQQGGPARDLQDDLSFFVAAAAVAGLLIAAMRMALGRSGAAAEDAAKGLVRLVLVSALTVPGIAYGAKAGDEFSTWILNRASDNDIEGQFTKLGALGATPLGVALTLILALLGMIAGVVQLMLMYARLGVLIILAGILPVTAAASTTPQGKAAFDRTMSWMIAFLLYKPVAAIVYAGAIYAVKDGQQTADQIAGVFLLIMAVLALPALLRVTAPVLSNVASGNNEPGPAAFGTLATGAVAVSAWGKRLGVTGTQNPTGAGQAGGGGAGPGAGGGGGRPGPPGVRGPIGPSGGGGGGGAAAPAKAGGAMAATRGGGGAAAGAGAAGGAIGAAVAVGAESVGKAGGAIRRGVRDVTGASGSREA